MLRPGAEARLLERSFYVNTTCIACSTMSVLQGCRAGELSQALVSSSVFQVKSSQHIKACYGFSIERDGAGSDNSGV